MNPFESILGGQSFQIDEQKHSSIEHGGEQPSCKSRGAHQSNGHAPDAVSPDNVIFLHPEPSPTAKYLDQSVDLETLRIPFARFPEIQESRAREGRRMPELVRICAGDCT